MVATCLSLKLFEIFKSVPMGAGGVILSDGITLLQILTWSTVTQKIRSCYFSCTRLDVKCTELELAYKFFLNTQLIDIQHLKLWLLKARHAKLVIH